MQAIAVWSYLACALMSGLALTIPTRPGRPYAAQSHRLPGEERADPGRRLKGHGGKGRHSG
jgi:hypothetical protein